MTFFGTTPTHLPRWHPGFFEVDPSYRYATQVNTPLDGGFKYFLFSSLPGEMIQFD